MCRPLADEIRPISLDEIVGQEHILGKNGLLRRIIESGRIPNMIFYGPSGTGKTTVARIIAQQTKRTLRRLNATTAGISDIKAIIDELDTRRVYCFIWTKSNISIKSSSNLCWNSLKTVKSPL